MHFDSEGKQQSHLSSEQQALVGKLLEERIQSSTSTIPESQDSRKIVPLPRSNHLPLSFAQQRLWFLEQLASGSPAYNQPISITLKGPLHRDVLIEALQQIVQRHEVFRSMFYTHDGKPVLSIVEDCTLDVPIIDVTSSPECDQEREVQDIVLAEATHVFDFSRPPLIRASIMCCSDNYHILLLNAHHIACDGNSLTLLFQELQALYAAGIQQEAVSLEPLPIQYVDFAHWQTQTANRNGDLEYWADKLADAPLAINIGGHDVTSRQFTFTGYAATATLSLQSCNALRSWSESIGATLFATVFAAFVVMLRSLTEQNDMVVGTLVDDRPPGACEKLIGLFLNPLPVRTTLADNPSFESFVLRVQETLWEAIEHQQVSFERIVAQAMPTYNRTLYPLFNVMISQEVLPHLELSGVQTELRYWDNDNGTAKYDLSLAILERKDGICLNIACGTNIFDEEILRQFAHSFQSFLVQLPGCADRRLFELVATVKERQVNATASGSEMDSAGSEVATPSPEVVAAIIAIWSEVLAAEHIRLDSNFFESGGHSLLALQVIGRVLEHFQSLLPSDTFEFEGQLLNALFEEPTVRTMALMVDEAVAAEIERMSDEEAQQLLDTMED